MTDGVEMIHLNLEHVYVENLSIVTANENYAQNELQIKKIYKLFLRNKKHEQST